ncbi:MAG: AMP-binding protein [Pararhodobacter sp.]|nr:AMP-binding protein [Pararhodobacter sp.]
MSRNPFDGLPTEESVAALFASTAARHPALPFVASRARAGGAFIEQGYGAFLVLTEDLRAAYRAAGWGPGARVAILTGNRPVFYQHYLALNGLGVSIVPLNPDARPAEMHYVITHSEADLVVVSADLRGALDAALAQGDPALPVIDALAPGGTIPPCPRPARDHQPDLSDEAAILYTSGTTGRPKGCVLSNRYFVESGHSYVSWDGRLALQPGCERLLNPLPLFHMNNLVVTTTALIMRAGCNVMVERFSPARWWADCAESKATLIHYLGVMPALLLAQERDPLERQHRVRAGIGAGVDPRHHAAFEERFGFPLLELWGMTEIGSGFIDNTEPRQLGTRAFGRPEGKLRARVVDDAMQDVPPGTPGELLVQSRDTANPRRGFFSGYLKDAAATDAAWHGDWFRSGDIVRQDASGMLYFVDRRKNIVRRSGENIAAAEVEACLQAHPAVLQAAVLAVPDPMREEEVFACVVLKPGKDSDAPMAQALFDWVFGQLSYFKAPGYICFRVELPTTGTQKIQKGLIFGDGQDPVTQPLTHDLRHLKKPPHHQTGARTAENAP